MGNLIFTPMPTLETNPELDLAFEYLSQTQRHLFLTGKAGTGKTTFLQRVRKEVPKRKVVVAPTGVAAINAKGVTIHSLFQLPFGVLTPERIAAEMPKRRFSGQKIDLFRSLDLLIIDEISMVRADILDAIDSVLRRYRASKLPFGGLQLLMIGDLYQLPPVVRPDDWRDMAPHYDTAYFFSSIALRKAAPTTIQLKKIYRQSDDTFIKLLNKVRHNRIDAAVLEQLNARYVKDFAPAEDDHYITLSSHNAAADEINQRRLGELKADEYTFSAEINGDFPSSMYPNDPHLTFKVGSQVMFNRNDSYPDRQFYNGKIGVIKEVDGTIIRVACPDEPDIFVEPVSWENRKFVLDPKTREIEEKSLGTYTQHPLRLAWAITIHKSQGLTFDRVIIDAAAAFAHGQVYVALSRCKSFAGIVLRSQISGSSVRTDRVVSNYTERAEANAPTDEDLRADKHEFQSNCLRELFNFSGVESMALYLQRTLIEQQSAIQGEAVAAYNEILQKIDNEVVNYGNRFLPHLGQYLRQAPLPAENPQLKERLDGAAPFFADAIRGSILPALAEFSIMSDNQAVRQMVEDRQRQLQQRLFVKRKLFEGLEDGFDPLLYLKTKADAVIDFENLNKQEVTDKKSAVPQNLKNRELYIRLLNWRIKTSKALGLRAYQVMTNPTMLSITQVLPTKKKSLLAVPKFGKKRYQDYGAAIIGIVKKYLEENPQAADLVGSGGSEKGLGKVDTRYQTLQLYQTGRDVREIALARGLKESTIYTHLSFWVKEKEVDAADVLEAETLRRVRAAIELEPEISMNDLYHKMDQKYDRGILNMVLASLG
ncbi:hypothetical protein CEQ90_14615 [Lewinellaceae bacterium SD302]|nr:hypothetical protein CEQ90_14615 [Lewinellaceae bacterium SD302]